METPSIWTIIILLINILLGLVAFFGGKILSGIQKNIEDNAEKADSGFQRLFDKLEGYQPVKSCVLAHENHDKIHALEKANQNEKFEELKTQINNVANIARSKVSRTHTE